MRKYKVVAIGLAIAIAAIQFIPIKYNKANGDTFEDFITTKQVPDNIAGLLKNSCYNCHSNNTEYPWYGKIQPTGLLLQRHINNGKSKLNFSEFGSLSERKQKSRLKIIIEQIEKGEMPLPSYTWIHTDAKLTSEEKTEVLEYLREVLGNYR